MQRRKFGREFKLEAVNPVGVEPLPQLALQEPQLYPPFLTVLPERLRHKYPGFRFQCF